MNPGQTRTSEVATSSWLKRMRAMEHSCTTRRSLGLSRMSRPTISITGVPSKRLKRRSWSLPSESATGQVSSSFAQTTPARPGSLNGPVRPESMSVPTQARRMLTSPWLISCGPDGAGPLGSLTPSV